MKVWDTLMGLELQLVDQLEETIKDFERNLADMYAGFLEQIRAQYPFLLLATSFITFTLQLSEPLIMQNCINQYAFTWACAMQENHLAEDHHYGGRGRERGQYK